MFGDSRRPSADAAGANRRPSHDAAHARRTHARHRRRKHAARSAPTSFSTSGRAARTSPAARTRRSFAPKCSTARGSSASRRRRTIRAEYAALIARDGRRIALTATCAANLLGSRSRGAFARGNAEGRATRLRAARASARRRAPSLARARARRRRREAAPRRSKRLIADYSLDRESVAIVGGGGGAGALVPALAERCELPYRIARDAEVIAPIGVALALVRDSVERTIVAPSPQEIARIRREAADRVVRGRRRAGSRRGRNRDRHAAKSRAGDCFGRDRAGRFGGSARHAARMNAGRGGESMRCEPSELAAFELTRSLTAYERRRVAVSALRRVREIRDVRVVDERGVVRLALHDPIVTLVDGRRDREARVREAIENATNFGDVGRALPALYLLRGGRIAAFEGLSSAEQGAALAAEEMDGCEPDERIALLGRASLAFVSRAR